MTVLEKIDNLEAAIFDYQIANIPNNTVNIFTEVIETGAIDTNNANLLIRLNVLMGACITAMQKKDYLLLADQLEFQLKPLIGGRG